MRKNYISSSIQKGIFRRRKMRHYGCTVTRLPNEARCKTPTMNSWSRVTQRFKESRGYSHNKQCMHGNSTSKRSQRRTHCDGTDLLFNLYLIHSVWCNCTNHVRSNCLPNLWKGMTDNAFKIFEHAWIMQTTHLSDF